MYCFRLHIFSGESQTLSLWFSQDEISSKREHIRKAILEIAEQQNPDTIIKLGLEKRKKATEEADKYNSWLNKMIASEFHFHRGYSEIQILGKDISEPNRRFDIEANTCASPTQPIAGTSSHVEQTDHEQQKDEEEKSLEIPPSINAEIEQPRRSKRIRKNKFVFNL